MKKVERMQTKIEGEKMIGRWPLCFRNLSRNPKWRIVNKPIPRKGRMMEKKS